MNRILNRILTERHYAYNDVKVSTTTAAYYNAYLLANFGIMVDKPAFVNKEVVQAISAVYKLKVPASFYNNPQDTAYFTATELAVEQIVSYFVVECTGTGATDENAEKYKRIEIFHKHLPQYTKGDEIVVRQFSVITSAEELSKVCTEIAANFAEYSRPFSIDELEEFSALVDAKYYDGTQLACRDNAVSMLRAGYNVSVFASMLDKKDLVKLSVQAFGENKQVAFTGDAADLIRKCLPYVHDCAMSKKQAKYFNTIRKKLHVLDVKQADNSRSPYKAATAALQTGDVVKAAQIYAANGSLLERNIKMLLSRANFIEAGKILDMLPAKNPIALYQMVSTLNADDGSARTFTFTKNNRLHKHVETDYETAWRKSKLNASTRKYLHDACFDKIDSYYAGLEKLGKVYIADNFYKVGVPTNTSANGKGIDTLPAGSRIKLQSNLIRSFVYWNDAFDIDASLTLVDGSGNTDILDFRNYSSRMSDMVRFSGDCRDRNGAEYFDIDLDELKLHGYKKVIFGFHGFNSTLNDGEIYCGYQVKKDFKTEAWDPKNIAMQMHVKGESRACAGFAIDLTTDELVVINQILDSESRVAYDDDVALDKWLDPKFLELNMGRILAQRGIIVDTPEEADVVFDDVYAPAEGQTAVRSYELEKLVGYVNA